MPAEFEPYSRLKSFAIDPQSSIFCRERRMVWIEEHSMKTKHISFKSKRHTVRGALSALSLGRARLLPRMRRRDEPATLFQRCLAVHIGAASIPGGLA
jgi:hypothetical protein